jgi:uncharacterized membrane protein YhhN
MTTAAYIAAAVAAIAALANWWSRWADDRVTERWSKPLVMVALIGMAVVLDPVDPTVRAWFVAALVFSLAGDVFLLGDGRWFVPGLVAFLVAHLAYTVGLIAADTWDWLRFAGVAAVLVAFGATVGARIVGGARREREVLGPAVVAYLIAISSMAAAAAATGNWWALAGAALFVVSDAVLGWRQFVARAAWMSLVVMVTYHLGQAGLVVSLLHS